MSEPRVQLSDDKGRVKLGRLFANKPYMILENGDEVRVIIITERSRRAQAEKKTAHLVSRAQTDMTLQGHPMDDETIEKLRKESLRTLMEVSPQILWAACVSPPLVRRNLPPSIRWLQ